MSTLKLILTLIFSISFFILPLSVDLLSAQCVACYHQANGNCSTELVNRNGAEACGCDSGCSCTGQCTIVGEGFNIKDLLNNDIEIPKEGLLTYLEPDEIEILLSEFRHEGIAGGMTISNVWFNDSIALYEISNYEYIIYPVENHKMDLFTCDGEFLTTIYDSSLLN